MSITLKVISYVPDLPMSLYLQKPGQPHQLSRIDAALAAHKEFKAQSHLTDPKEIQNRIKIAHQVATIIKKNVVQGQKKAPESDTYGILTTNAPCSLF